MTIAEIGVLILVIIFGGQLAFFLIMNILLDYQQKNDPEIQKQAEENQRKLEEADKIIEELNNIRPCYKVGEKSRETLEEAEKSEEEYRRKKERLQQLLEELNKNDYSNFFRN